MSDPLRELAALGVESTIILDGKGNARVNISGQGPTFGPVAEAIREAVLKHRRARPHAGNGQR